MEDDTRLFSAPLQLSKREPRTHIPPRKRRRNIVTQPCLNCHTSKHECDRKRPCQRCILLGLAGLCVYETDGPALTDDQTVDELTTRQIIAELGSELHGVYSALHYNKFFAAPLPVGSATGRPHPLWADGDGDPCHPQAAILTSVYFWRCTSVELIS
ncbi:hypothetical protein BDR05DRAFT_895920 [Suillus weaverae]|nr:hypothetical protein BDR05DRAFT_895920 [Suillus weaverae]